MTSYFHKAKEHGIQGQLNRRYCITYTPGHVAVQFNQHGNCTISTVATLMLGMFQVVFISKISVELTTFLLNLQSYKWNGIIMEGVLQPVSSNAATLFPIMTLFLISQKWNGTTNVDVIVMTSQWHHRDLMRHPSMYTNSSRCSLPHRSVQAATSCAVCARMRASCFIISSALRAHNSSNISV